MSKQPCVSVIVPVYNAQKYLEQCLQSLADQTMADFEVICVDDGSTDSSVEMIRGFMQRDARFTLVQQKNQYAGIARNNGIAHAKGEYLLFLDADDFFHPELMARTYAQAKKTDADVVLFGAKTYDMERDAMINTPYLMRQKLLPAKEVFSHRDVPDYFLQITNSCPWLQLYRKQYILDEGIRFQGLPNTNDAYFVIVALCCAKRVTAVKEDFVYYRVNTGASTQDKKYRNPTCFMTAYLAIYEELNRRGIYKELEKTFASKVVMSCAHHIRSTVNPRALREIYEAICGAEFAKTGVFEHPSSYYFDPEKAQLVRAVPTAMKLLESRGAQEGSVQMLAQGAEMEKTLVSVILPVTQEEPYLRASMEALVGQSLPETEILCVVESGCTKEKELLKDFAKRDSRVWVITAGEICMAAARNIALERATGEYVYFADCRDLLDQEALGEAQRYARQHALDVVCFDSEAFSEEAAYEKETQRRRERYRRSHVYRDVYQGEQFIRMLRRDKESQPLLGQQLIRMQHLRENELVFDEQIPYVSWHAFAFGCMIAAKRVGYLHKTLQRRRICAQRMPAPSFAAVLGWFRAYMKMSDYVCSHALERTNQNEIGIIVKSALWMAQDQYAKLEEREACAFRLLEIGEQMQFGLYVVEPAKFKQESKKQHSSVLYKAYRAFDYVGRKVPDGLYYLREYGMKYTIARMGRKLLTKLKG